MLRFKPSVILGVVACCGLAVPARGQTRPVEVDAGKLVGTIRSLQGVNGGPAPIRPGSTDFSRQYRDLRIDLVRVHDFFGPGDIDATWPDPDRIARFVRADASLCLFPRWDADPDKEESYNFGPTDRVVQAVVGCGAGVFFRVGRSWSADPTPPDDFDKFARVARHVAMHYNDGWAHGFHDKIRYWEVWNEPDLKAEWALGFARPFWSGTPEQYYRLYETVARSLKAYDPGLKVGGPAQAAGGFGGPYREGLIAYCAAHEVPLDFYSWHRYTTATRDPYDFARVGRDIRRLLDARGFRNTEIIVDEWNLHLNLANLGDRDQTSMDNAAFTASALIYKQDAPVDHSMYYRGDAGAMGMFDPDGTYRKKAYAYKTLGRMLDTPRRLEARGADTFGFAVLAGRSDDGRTVQVLVSNYEIPEAFRTPRPAAPFAAGLKPRTEIRYGNNRGYILKVKNLPWGDADVRVTRYRTTPSEDWAEIRGTARGDTVELSSELPPPGVELIVLQRQ